MIIKVFYNAINVYIVLLSTALLFNRLGPTQNKTTVGWCWVNVTQEGAVWWMLLTGTAWELLACIFLVVLCVLIRRRTTNQVRIKATINILPFLWNRQGRVSAK